MSVPFTQAVSATFDAVVNERNKAQNQFAESAFLTALDKKGGIKRVAGGDTLTFTVDYRKNTGTDFLANDFTTTGTSKTEVLTQAQYDWATLVVPVNWSITDEAKNSDANRKVELVSSLVDNAIASHDDELEAGFFAGSATDGFLPLAVLADPTANTGTVGAIDSSQETWWGNQVATYDISDADIETVLPLLYHKCAKGSGSKYSPNLAVSGVTPYSQFESQLQANQRYGPSDKGQAGFEFLKVVNADYVFSKNGGTAVFMLNTMNTKLYVISGAFRQRRAPVEHINAYAMNMKVGSVLQFATNNRSRMGHAKSQA